MIYNRNEMKYVYENLMNDFRINIVLEFISYPRSDKKVVQFQYDHFVMLPPKNLHEIVD